MSDERKLAPEAPPTLAERMRAATSARVAIGRIGSSIPTRAALDFQLAHARARDAVHAQLDAGAYGSTLHGHPVLEVCSQAADRGQYLMRPDLGRRLAPGMAERLSPHRSDLAIILADGLSATAVRAHAANLVGAILARAQDWQVGPIIVAHQARVALADEIGEALKAKISVILIGERPGLSAADSLSAYITWQPRKGRLDSERNCISNIRPPHGWRIEDAAGEVLRIARAARRIGCTGVGMIAEQSAHQGPVLEG
ncbi:ethanolamine ammonia-lyase subunit EutC [Novosphingobium profundi]|uniref:ethanolamine ammonia-lyase subunit EutC n=1 Tax=Novosphingobium profundi TaxID=1774954 RepID=UPI0031BA2A90